MVRAYRRRYRSERSDAGRAWDALVNVGRYVVELVRALYVWILKP